ncbi:tRNA-guanine transglycosylase DpdA [Stigmatella aurantiaca]|uniref:Conserved uncharacterized protein n=2 Tax=Stigmatella aurantiaca (strain DW4/3-1) TaxID=378806 RepID=E3FUF0_STIAD|nr:tRNA-guanine transglycosylase DpdA [Stigmatella aurantiaca]ADO74648.1 conserved uncharacterized protein [Stigmatella aurantiaca DW4/3-1]
MKFFLPDSQDLVDPSFDFENEQRSKDRRRQRHDLYAHEVFSQPAFDGFLVSKGMVDGFGALGSRYTLSQRLRLSQMGAPEFFRVERAPHPLQIMGDCGAFTYVKEQKPPYSVDDVIDFYATSRFDYGVSLDHVILDFIPEADAPGAGPRAVPAAIRHRQELTLQYATEFLHQHRLGRHAFKPLGVAQGWSPQSYATSVKRLQKMGYDYIALGGMVPLKTQDILRCLQAIQDQRAHGTRLHLLGVTRTEHLEEFYRLGVASFDSTSPLRQAFKDAHDNYYFNGQTYTAIRIPQVEGNTRLQQRIASGQISQNQARKLETACLQAMRLFDAGRRSLSKVIEVLLEYEDLYAHDVKRSHAKDYERTLTDAPWRQCACDICKHLKYHVIIFRGAERNRRRGFHNIWSLYHHMRGSGTGIPEFTVGQHAAGLKERACRTN